MGTIAGGGSDVFFVPCSLQMIISSLSMNVLFSFFFWLICWALLLWSDLNYMDLLKLAKKAMIVKYVIVES